MMKRITFLALATLLFGTAMAQTFVSTTPANKNVIVEEYTGARCQYCPDGHRIVNGIMTANPGRVFAINVHTGSFTGGYYVTPWGDTLASQWGVTSFPSGIINRHAFPTSSGSTQTVLNRGSWQQASNIIMAEAAPVNVAARCTIDYQTRQLTVVVEAYYTDNSAASTNYMNVVLLQNNIIGPQTGGSNYNASQMVGTQYRHMHMLRDMITGMWGDPITSTSQGSFFTQTYNYTIPATISNETVKMEDLELVVFVAQSRSEILNGCGVSPVIVNGIPQISAVEEDLSPYDCDMSFKAKATVRNFGNTPMTSAVFSYSIGGNTNTYNWTGNVAVGATEEVSLPVMTGSFTNGTNYTLTVNLTQANGETISGGQAQTTMSKSSYTVEGPVNLLLHTDTYASETSLKFMKADGTVIKSWGPGNNGTEQNINLTFDPAEAGCYVLEVYDAYGDGISGQYGNGYFTLSNAAGQIVRDNGAYGAMARYYLHFTNNGGGSNGIDGTEIPSVSIYPNPVNDMLNIAAQELRRVDILDMNGRTVMSGTDTQVNVSTLAAGMYIARVTTETGVTLKKVVKN